MIDKISASVAKWLLEKGAISADAKPLYEYAFFCFLITALPVITVSIIGLVAGMFWEGLMLIAPFVFIRKFSGGYHLKSSNLCMVVSTFILAAFLFASKAVCVFSLYIPFAAIAAIAAVSLMVFSPIDSEERKLSEKENSAFKTVARIMTLAISALWIALMLFGLKTAAVSIGCGLILSAALQVPCIIKKLSGSKKQLETNGK